MKTSLSQIFTLCLIGVAAIANATVLTVDNNGNAPAGVYTDMSTAIGDAIPGDTILVVPSSSTYGNFSIDKAITIIGVGFNPDMEIPFTSKAGIVTVLTAASGAKIIGLEITNRIFLGNTAGALSDLVIENNRINYIQTSNVSSLTNVLIRQNVIQVVSTSTSNISLSATNQSNIRITNNVIGFAGTNTTYRGPVVSTGGVTFDHNLFLGTAAQEAFYQVTNCLITNNVFVTINPGSTSTATNLLYKNNLSNGYEFSGIAGNNITFEGNLDLTDPTFVNLPLNTVSYDYSLDPNLAVGSAGEAAATDGTDLGVGGGTSPFKLSGSVLPVVRRFDVPSNIIEGSNADAAIEVTGN